jgi:CheY-like chemotaxis protein
VPRLSGSDHRDWGKNEDYSMRILLADHQARVRFALRALLDQQPGLTVVGETGEAAETLSQVAAVHPDLVLLDWDLHGSVIDLLPAMHRVCPELRVIALRSTEMQPAILAWRRCVCQQDRSARSFVGRYPGNGDLLISQMMDRCLDQWRKRVNFYRLIVLLIVVSLVTAGLQAALNHRSSSLPYLYHQHTRRFPARRTATTATASAYPAVPYELISQESIFAYLTDLTSIQPYSGWRNSGSNGEAEALDYVAGKLSKFWLQARGWSWNDKVSRFSSVELWETRLHLTVDGQEIEVLSMDYAAPL